MEKPLRFDRMSGLDEKQLDELEGRVSELLEKPWDKDAGRPREVTFREALVVTCGYMRQNIIEEVWADIFDVDQSTISRIITFLTPLIEQATAGFRPAPEEAALSRLRAAPALSACEPAAHIEQRSGRVKPRCGMGSSSLTVGRNLGDRIWREPSWTRPNRAEAEPLIWPFTETPGQEADRNPMVRRRS